MLNNLYETSTKLVMPKDLNSYGTLFGGNLIAWMDELAVILAIKATKKECVLLYFDNIEIRKGLTTNDIVHLKAEIVHTGKCHLDIKVRACKANNFKENEYMAQGDAKFVVLDENKKPTAITIDDRWNLKKGI